MKHGVSYIQLIKDMIQEMRIWVLRAIHDLPNDNTKIEAFEQFLQKYHNPVTKETVWRDRLYADIKSMAEESLERGEKVKEKEDSSQKGRRVKVPRRMVMPSEKILQSIESQPAIVQQLHKKDPKLLSELQEIFA